MKEGVKIHSFFLNLFRQFLNLVAFYIGNKWGDALEKCIRGRYRPVLLIYANPMFQQPSTASIVSNNNIPENSNIMPKELKPFRPPQPKDPIHVKNNNNSTNTMQ